MRLIANTLTKLEKLSQPYLDKGHAIKKSIYITFFSNKYAVKLANKPDNEMIKLNKRLDSFTE